MDTPSKTIVVAAAQSASIRRDLEENISNYAGSTGGSVSAGKSAVWDGRGNLIAQANSNQEALVVARCNNREWHGGVVTYSA